MAKGHCCACPCVPGIPKAPRTQPCPVPETPVTLMPFFDPAQAQRITAPGSAATASWTSCAPTSVAVRAPSWTAPTRSWPASQATSLNTSPTCKCCPGVNVLPPPRTRTCSVTLSQPEQGLREVAPSWLSHMGSPWLSSASWAEGRQPGTPWGQLARTQRQFVHSEHLL